MSATIVVPSIRGVDWFSKASATSYVIKLNLYYELTKQSRRMILIKWRNSLTYCIASRQDFHKWNRDDCEVVYG